MGSQECGVRLVSEMNQDRPEESGPLAKGLRDFHSRTKMLLLMTVHLGHLVGYGPDDVVNAIPRAMVILSDRLATRGRDTLSQQERESMEGTLQGLATSFRVEGPATPTVESLSNFLLDAFSYLPVDGWKVDRSSPDGQ